ncbi:MAG: neutral zinc metallopeptidase [Bacteroidia bacterium]|nr:neutral zinc metallopeptidase [Bacteroidia bacterium]
MRWKGRQGSSNVEDRRGHSGGGGGGFRPSMGGGGGNIIVILLGLLFGRKKKMGMGTLLILGAVALYFWWSSSSQSAAVSPNQNTRSAETATQGNPDDELAQFVSVVLKETEDVWDELFPKYVNKRYQKPKLVLFSGSTRSACGYASAATGPFYCPGDQKLYIDLSFYQDLKNKFGAPGDFAMAYVVAHEVAHHVQYLLGATRYVDSQRGRVSQAVQNQLSVKLELQADFYSGVWANKVQGKGLLEDGDIEEALRAANAIGDDRLQKQSQGYVVPESFTHGTSEQRMRWFRKGYQTGDPTQGDTFNARVL